ncbi:hypothetical protein F5X68DRAFT_61386 [Plectosphaerella plurivora]|uniref:Uncharacterized protein n=1 Tax=Plectosphaerella plurivora TaxID=936078 RepID=A0A9P8V0W6_9PEZI|nr:hypothetical protein F5X68DRAFT_61386 [Plectosphaerella plurivora]
MWLVAWRTCPVNPGDIPTGHWGRGSPKAQGTLGPRTVLSRRTLEGRNLGLFFGGQAPFSCASESEGASARRERESFASGHDPKLWPPFSTVVTDISIRSSNTAWQSHDEVARLDHPWASPAQTDGRTSRGAEGAKMPVARKTVINMNHEQMSILSAINAMRCVRMGWNGMDGGGRADGAVSRGASELPGSDEVDCTTAPFGNTRQTTVCTVEETGHRGQTITSFSFL